MNVRKSSLPVTADEKHFLSTHSSPIKNLWYVAKKRLVGSCSKIDNRHESIDSPKDKIHSFPGSTVAIEASQTSSVDSSKSDSSVSITDTLLKVRRLTHVYDQEELIAKCKGTKLLYSLKSREIPDDQKDDYNDSKDKIMEIQKPCAKLGDRSYKLPSKAAAILGADDLLVHQLLHDNITSINSHALFLENKVQKSLHPDCEVNDANSKALKLKKRTGIGSEVKEKIASLWKQSELNTMSGSTPSSGSGCYNSPSVLYGAGTTSGLQLKDMEKLLRAGKATLEQIKNWSNSFESLLHDKFGLAHFHDFLRSEFSDENIEFWIACEEYRTITNNKKLLSRAEKIYNDYVGVQAAREVNLDSKTRQQTEIDIRNPSPHTFDQAQKRIQALMEKDSYQRFLRSELYGRLVRTSEEYHLNQLKSAREPCKGLTISNLGVTAQDLSKFTMTTSKLALVPHTNVMITKSNRDHDHNTKISISKTSRTQPAILTQHETSVICSVHPDEPSLPFSKLSLIFTPDDKPKH